VEDILKDLGQTIKKARQAAELTQDGLAECVGITGRYIMAIENENKQPSIEVLYKIIRALSIPADSIFFSGE
jgi:DNA-binding XRE family transcriptional regulator